VVAQRIRGLTGYHGAKISEYLLDKQGEDEESAEANVGRGVQDSAKNIN
jgi:hypothetical protein